MIEDDEFSFVRSEYNGKVYSRMINRAHKQIPQIKNMITRELKELISEYFGGNFQIVYTAMWRNYHVPPEVQAEKEIFFLVSGIVMVQIQRRLHYSSICLM